MAKATIIFEDVGARSVTIQTSIEGDDGASKVGASPAAVLTLATRAMFDNGMLAELGAVALVAFENNEVPSECILAHFNKKKDAG